MIRAPRIEWLFAALILIGIGVIGWHLQHDGYLPQPFYPDVTDSWMDGYNTAWWAHSGHVYDEWHAIYPPLAFVFMRIFTVARCYDSDPLLLRDCDHLLIGTLAFLFLVNSIIAWRSFRVADRSTALPRAFAVGFGLPALSALDRGQLVIVAMTFFFLGFGPLLRSSRGRMFAAAIAINFKPYLVVPVLIQFIARRWRWVEGVLVGTLLVWLASVAAFGEGNPITLIENIVAFGADTSRAGSWRLINYSTSYTSIVRFLNSDSVIVARLDRDSVMAWMAVFAAACSVVQLLSVAAFAAIWARRHPISRTRAALLAYGFVILTSETGGYAQAGLVFLVFFERWEGPARIFALICAYILCVPFDISLGPGAFPLGRIDSSYLTGRPVRLITDMTLGPFLRPGLILGIQAAMAVQVLLEIRGAHASPRPAQAAAA